jgi:hypothetical protein
VTEGIKRLGYTEFVALAAGDPLIRDRLANGERLLLPTPFYYPGRRGAVTLELTPGKGDVSGSRPVRMTDAGGLIKSLDDQGFDVSIDMIVSKTVVHAVKELDGTGVGSGEIYLDSTPDTITDDMWRFLQLISEVLGLRHCKYKDALLQLSRRPATAPLDAPGWDQS